MEEGKKKNNTALIILVVLLMVLCLGMGGYIFISKDNKSTNFEKTNNDANRVQSNNTQNNTSKNVHSKIYYYKLFTDKKPDLSKTNYDILERQTDFELFYVPVKNIRLFLEEGLKNKKIDKNIYDEMLLVIDEYNRIFGGVYY